MALSMGPLGKKKTPQQMFQTDQAQVASPTALKPPSAPTPPREVGPVVRPPAGQPTAGGFSGGGGGGPQFPPSGLAPAPVTPPPAPRQPPPTVPAGGGGATGGGGANIDVTGPGERGTRAWQEKNDKNNNGIDDAMEKYFPPPPPPPPEEPATNEELDKQIRSLMEDLVAGRGMDVSTAEEEALIRELMQDRLGQGLVEQRARMGRAGFGASGALAAMEGDIRRQAGQQATQETLALRRQAEEDAIRNALEAVGVDIRSREEGRRAVFDEEFLNALKSSLGMDTGEGGDSGRPQTPPANLGETPTPGQGRPREDRQDPAPRPAQKGSVFMVGSKAAVPNNAAYSRTEAGYDIYVDTNGNEYHVPAGA